MGTTTKTYTVTHTFSKTIFSHGTLFDLDINRWGAIKRMAPEDMLLEKIDKDALYLGHKKLLPRKATIELVKIEGQARAHLMANSIQFPIAGARFVAFKALSKVVKALNIYKKQFLNAVVDLVDEYESFKTQQIALLDNQANEFASKELGKIPSDQRETKAKDLELWKLLQHVQHQGLYPTKDELQQKYNFEWRVYKLSPLDEASAVDAETLALFQEKYEQDIEKWAKEAATMMHKALGEAAVQARAMLEKQGKLNPKNIKPLFQAFETFKNVDFTGKSSFQKVIDEIKSKYGGEDATEAINASEESKHEFSELLGAMGHLALETTAEQAGVLALHSSGFQGRVIDLA